MSETRKLAAIIVTDVVGYSRLAGADEQRTLARLRALRGDLVEPAVAAHYGRIVKGTGDGSIIEFRSAVDAARCAIEIQNGLIERNAGAPPERRIEFRVGIHVGEVVEESDGDLMGDAVNIAARLEGIAKPGTICLSEDAYRQVKGRLEIKVSDLGPNQLKNIAEPVRAYLIEVDRPDEPLKPASAPRHRLVAALAVLAILIAGGAAGWRSIASKPSGAVGSSTAPTASLVGSSVATAPVAGNQPLAPSDGAADRDSLADRPAAAAASPTTPTAPSPTPTADVAPATDTQPATPTHALPRRQVRPASISQPDTEPTARRAVRSSAKGQPSSSEPGQSPSGEGASDCFVSAAQLNGNHVSCAYLRGQPPNQEQEQPRSVESASNSSQPCSVPAAQTNANHVSCAYLRGY
jgi:class 3 adenylate cyclase